MNWFGKPKIGTQSIPELIINALEYAHRCKLDINNKDHVKKIVVALDPQHAGEEEIYGKNYFKVSINSFGEIILVFLCFLNFSICLSPLINISAFASSTNSKRKLSF